MIAVKKVIGIGLISVTALSLSGCGLIPLPDEERYSKVNAVKDQLDFESAGKVISEEYSGDGVWSGSIYTAEIEGESSFEDLSNQLKLLSELKGKCTFSDEEVNCLTPVPYVTLDKIEAKSLLVIGDTSGGRDEK